MNVAIVFENTTKIQYEYISEDNGDGYEKAIDFDYDRFVGVYANEEDAKAFCAEMNAIYGAYLYFYRMETMISYGNDELNQA